LIVGAITNATLTIVNDNSYGTLQIASPSYTVMKMAASATSPSSQRRHDWPGLRQLCDGQWHGSSG